MKYSLLGKSGLRVSELALGAMTFGTEWGWGTEKNEARKMLDLYIDNGGNFVDTANVYTNGSSEKRSIPVLATQIAAATIVKIWFVQWKQVFKE